MRHSQNVQQYQPTSSGMDSKTKLKETNAKKLAIKRPEERMIHIIKEQDLFKDRHVKQKRAKERKRERRTESPKRNKRAKLI